MSRFIDVIARFGEFCRRADVQGEPRISITFDTPRDSPQYCTSLVRCTKCPAQLGEHGLGAATAWNTRPQPTHEAVEKIREALATAFYNVHVPCSHTDSHGWHTYCHTLADVALNYFPTPDLMPCIDEKALEQVQNMFPQLSKTIVSAIIYNYLEATRPAMIEAEWEDRPDDYSEAIKAAWDAPHDYDLYCKAFEMVGNRNSKIALLQLVYWLLKHPKEALAYAKERRKGE